ncbi:MAG: hypothetical protein HYY52_06425 [Candidatus Melainabacteria bacterium]|nr:hypothetical protein [Candidatus Melainabacteria bacterium]
MTLFNNLFGKCAKLQIFLKGSLILIILFLMFFAINLFISIQFSKKSAYDALTENTVKEKVMLQDTRVHNWSEVNKKN